MWGGDMASAEKVNVLDWYSNQMINEMTFRRMLLGQNTRRLLYKRRFFVILFQYIPPDPYTNDKLLFHVTLKRI